MRQLAGGIVIRPRIAMRHPSSFGCSFSQVPWRRSSPPRSVGRLPSIHQITRTYGRLAVTCGRLHVACACMRCEGALAARLAQFRGAAEAAPGHRRGRLTHSLPAQQPAAAPAGCSQLATQPASGPAGLRAGWKACRPVVRQAGESVCWAAWVPVCLPFCWLAGLTACRSASSTLAGRRVACPSDFRPAVRLGALQSV